MGNKIFPLFFILTLIFLPVLTYGQPIESQVQINVSGTVEYRDPFVITKNATSIGISQATLQGELTSLGAQPSVDVFFQYRMKDSSLWQETPKQTKEDLASFNATLLALSENTTYEFRAGVEWLSEESFGNVLEFTTGEEPSVPSPPSDSRWRPPEPSKTIVIFEGKAYPDAFLTIMKNNQTIATFFADSTGLFKKQLTEISGGNYNFRIWAEDKEFRKSVTSNFTITLLKGMTTTVSGIFISPTIELSADQVQRGGDVDIFGRAFPMSEIKIFIEPEGIVKETKADEQGRWNYAINTSFLQNQDYSVKARAFYGDGEFSPFSSVVNFSILKSDISICQGADLNFDNKVDIVDFSILLYFWEQSQPTNVCADINQDQIVDIIDFSIMMYEWTK